MCVQQSRGLCIPQPPPWVCDDIFINGGYRSRASICRSCLRSRSGSGSSANSCLFRSLSSLRPFLQLMMCPHISWLSDATITHINILEHFNNYQVSHYYRAILGLPYPNWQERKEWKLTLREENLFDYRIRLQRPPSFFPWLKRLKKRDCKKFGIVVDLLVCLMQCVMSFIKTPILK